MSALVAALRRVTRGLPRRVVREGCVNRAAAEFQQRTGQALCGPRYAHHADRPASRAGTVPSEVVLGGRKVAMQRARVRAKGREVPLPTFPAVAQADPLKRPRR